MIEEIDRIIYDLERIAGEEHTLADRRRFRVAIGYLRFARRHLVALFGEPA